MSHAVQYQDASGEMRVEDAASLHAALERVEDLQNTDGATGIRVFREVPIEVRTYYRVVVAEDAPAEPAPASRPPEQVAEPMVEPAEQVVQASMAPPVAEPMEPPSGAMVMSRQPVGVAAEAPGSESVDDAAHHDHRRLFTRSS